MAPTAFSGAFSQVGGGGPLSLSSLNTRGIYNANDRPTLTLDQAALQLTRDGLSWGSLGQPTTITWGFRQAGLQMPNGVSGFSTFTGSQIITTQMVLLAWADVANIVFQSDSEPDHAAILFGNYVTGAPGAGGFAFLPGSREANSTAGDVWINASLAYNETPTSTNYGWFTLLHEVGHALGLSHPSDYDAASGSQLFYGTDASYTEDSNLYTVMSYFSATAAGGAFGSTYPMAPMIDDIAAIQRLYGVNTTTRAGDTIYGFNSNAERPWYSAATTSVPVFTVWDAGGTDTLDFSLYGSATIDMRQGSLSDVGGGRSNIGIARGTVVENLITGAGNDTITGNSADNRITPGGGANFVDGGLGIDTVVFDGAFADFVFTAQQYDVRVMRPGGTVGTGVRNVEWLVFTDRTIATPLAGFQYGLQIYGDVTDETLIGTAFYDILQGLEGNDTIQGFGGLDDIVGGRGDDILDGGDGDDRIDTGPGNDVVLGGAGADLITIGPGNSRVDGGAGIDTLRYGGFGGWEVDQRNHTNLPGILVDLGAGYLRGAAGYGTVTGIENVTGTTGSDLLTGDGTANVLAGGDEGRDVLRGGGGDDTLTGGSWSAGTAPDLVKSSFVGNNSLANAVSLDASFRTGGNEGSAFGAGYHAVVRATGHGGLEYYAVTTNGAFVLDIDDASFDTTIRVFNAAGVQIASNDDGRYANDTGSPTDSYLEVRTNTAGVYYIEVGRYAPAADGGFASIAPPPGSAYTLWINTTALVPTDDTTRVGSFFEGGDGNDVITSRLGGWIDGGAGDDSLNIGNNTVARGGAGNDRIVSQPTSAGGDNSTAVYNGVFSDYVLTRNGDVTTISSAAEGVDTLTWVEFARFSDRVVWLNAPTRVINGTAGSDGLVGPTGGSIIIGGGGADTLVGSGGYADVFRYLAASDSNAVAYDTINAFETGQDRIDLTALSPTSVSLIRTNGSTFLFADTPTGPLQILTLNRNIIGDDILFEGPLGVYMTGTDLSEALTGSYRADSIVGGGGRDLIIGGRGGDALSGGAGADRFRYLAADESSATSGIDNLYDFETGVDLIDLTALAATSVSIIRSDNGSSFVFAETPAGGFLTTAAGRTINAGDIHHGGSFGIYMVGSSNSDILTGTSLADPIAGGAGDDIIIGGGGADALFGDAGADLFVYRSVLDSMEGAADGIFGFVSGQDRIDLSGLRNSAADVFGIAYLGTGSFLFVDIGGDGYNELVIQLANTTLVASDINWGSAPSSAAPAAGPTAAVGLTVLNEAATDFAEWSSLIGQTGGAMADLETVWAHGRHGPDWYL